MNNLDSLRCWWRLWSLRKAIHRPNWTAKAPASGTDWPAALWLPEFRPKMNFLNWILNRIELNWIEMRYQPMGMRLSIRRGRATAATAVCVQSVCPGRNVWKSPGSWPSRPAGWPRSARTSANSPSSGCWPSDPCWSTPVVANGQYTTPNNPSTTFQSIWKQWKKMGTIEENSKNLIDDGEN